MLCRPALAQVHLQDNPRGRRAIHDDSGTKCREWVIGEILLAHRRQSVVLDAEECLWSFYIQCQVNCRCPRGVARVCEPVQDETIDQRLDVRR